MKLATNVDKCGKSNPLTLCRTTCSVVSTFFISRKPWWNQRRNHWINWLKSVGDSQSTMWTASIEITKFIGLVSGKIYRKTMDNPYFWVGKTMISDRSIDCYFNQTIDINSQHPRGPHRNGLHAAADPHGREDGPPGAARGGGGRQAWSIFEWNWMGMINCYLMGPFIARGLLIRHAENVGKVPFEWDMRGKVSINRDIVGK